MSDTANLEIYKEVRHGEECWTVFWDQMGPFAPIYKYGFKTFYDAEHYVRTISGDKKFSSDFDDLFDENGNEVYTKEKARYQIVKPNSFDWQYYAEDLENYKKSCKLWDKWYMKIIKLFHEPNLEEPRRPEYVVEDRKRKLQIWSGTDPRAAVNFIRTRQHSTSVYYYNNNIQLVSKE